MNEDLGKYLLERVPPPPSGYWESIDDAIDQESSETDPTLNRLTDMTNNKSRAPWFLAAAAVLLVVVAAAALATRSTTDRIDTTADSTPSSQQDTSTTSEAIGTTTSEVATEDDTTTSETVADPDSSPLSAFDTEDVEQAGLDALGCWFEAEDDRETFEPLAFFGENGAFIILDETPLTLVVEPDAGTVDFGARTAYSSDAYRISVVGLGEPEPTSNESNTRTATIRLTSPDADEFEVTGVLECGV